MKYDFNNGILEFEDKDIAIYTVSYVPQLTENGDIKLLSKSFSYKFAQPLVPYEKIFELHSNSAILMNEVSTIVPFSIIEDDIKINTLSSLLTVYSEVEIINNITFVKYWGVGNYFPKLKLDFTPKNLLKFKLMVANF